MTDHCSLKSVFNKFSWMLKAIWLRIRYLLLSMDLLLVHLFHIVAKTYINFIHIDALLILFGDPVLNVYPKKTNSKVQQLVKLKNEINKYNSNSLFKILRYFIAIILLIFIQYLDTLLFQVKLAASVVRYNNPLLKNTTPNRFSTLIRSVKDNLRHFMKLKKKSFTQFLTSSIIYSFGTRMLSVCGNWGLLLFTPFFPLFTKWKMFWLHYFDFNCINVLPGYLPLFKGTRKTIDEHLHQDRTCWSLFDEAVQNNPIGQCLGKRKKQADGSLAEWQWLSYEQVKWMSLEIGTALWKLNLCKLNHFPNEQYFNAQKLRCLGIFLKTCPEWIIFQQSCAAFGITVIPMYETLGNEAMSFIANQTEISSLVVSIELWDTLQALINTMPTVKSVIIIREDDCYDPTLHGLKIHMHTDDIVRDNENEQRIDSPQDLSLMRSTYPHLKFYTFEDLVRFGRCDTMKARDVSPDDVFILYYTSGTTGMPKGVIATHRTISATLKSLNQSRFETASMQLGSEDVHASYLPMAHILGGLLTTLVLTKGAAIGNLSNDTSALLRDLSELQPTFIVTVPRVLNKMFNEIKRQMILKSTFARTVLEFAIDAKLRYLRMTGSPYHPIWDLLLFSKCRDLLGGRFRFILTGGAPLDPTVEEKLKIVMCCPIIQAYGLTETLGAAFASTPYETETGHVGSCLPPWEFTMEAVSEMSYDPLGEVLVRGPPLSPGYFRCPDLTKEVFTEDGWFHTGDIGEMLTTGSLRIIDRKKNIFKLSQGEYVAPEKIENIYTQIPLIAQAFVFGYSTKDCLVGIIVPDINSATLWAHKEGIESASFSDLITIEKFKLLIFEQIRAIESMSGLKGFEKVAAIRLTSEPFTVENNLLTPTLKLKRNIAKKKYQKEIDEMYAELSRE